jgi:hypothetical protein
MDPQESPAVVDELIAVLRNPSSSNEALQRASFDLYILLKPSIIVVPEDAGYVVPVSLTALHNDDPDSTRDDADAALYEEVGKDKQAVEILCTLLKETLKPERMQESRDAIDKLQTNILACLMILSRSMFKST